MGSWHIIITQLALIYSFNYILEREYFEYQETKPSNKFTPAIFPAFHCVALSIVYTFHPDNVFSNGCITDLFHLTSTADSKRNPQDDIHDEVYRETLDQGGDELNQHGDQKCHAPSVPVGYPAKEIRAEQLARVEYGFCEWHIFLCIVT